MHAGFDYDSPKAPATAGYRSFSHDLSRELRIHLYLKPISPSNNLEIKFIDSTGNNVWWVIYRIRFPEEWQEAHCQEKHISLLAHGRSEPKRSRPRIEFTVSSPSAGKGTPPVRRPEFEPLHPETVSYPSPASGLFIRGKHIRRRLWQIPWKKHNCNSLVNDKYHIYRFQMLRDSALQMTAGRPLCAKNRGAAVE